IYQRFQRGIMHFDKTCGCTQGLLLADYLKSLVTGQNLPADLAAQAATSPLLHSATNGKAPPATAFGNAFSPGSGSVPATVAPDPPVLALPPPTPVPSPDYGLSMFLWNQAPTTDRDLKIASGANFHWQKTLFQWRQIEGTAKGVYDWSEADRVVK